MEDQTASEGSWEASGIEVGEEPPVGGGVEACITSVGIINGPADAVVAVSVGGPGCRRGFVGDPTQGRLHEADIAGSQNAPQLYHEAVVVGHFADLAPVTPAPEVINEVVGPTAASAMKATAGAIIRIA